MASQIICSTSACSRRWAVIASSWQGADEDDAAVSVDAAVGGWVIGVRMKDDTIIHSEVFATMDDDDEFGEHRLPDSSAYRRHEGDDQCVSKAIGDVPENWAGELH